MKENDIPQCHTTTTTTTYRKARTNQCFESSHRKHQTSCHDKACKTMSIRLTSHLEADFLLFHNINTTRASIADPMDLQCYPVRCRRLACLLTIPPGYIHPLRSFCGRNDACLELSAPPRRTSASARAVYSCADHMYRPFGSVGIDSWFFVLYLIAGRIIAANTLTRDPEQHVRNKPSSCPDNMQSTHLSATRSLS